MIKQISLNAPVVIGIGALFLGTILTPVFPTVPPSHSGNSHGEGEIQEQEIHINRLSKDLY